MTPEFLPMVYLLASRRNGTIYTGATSRLLQRVAQHRARTSPGFTRKHGIKLLVWFEPHRRWRARSCERNGSRSGPCKLELIEAANPDWRDLAEDFGFPALPESF